LSEKARLRPWKNGFAGDCIITATRSVRTWPRNSRRSRLSPFAQSSTRASASGDTPPRRFTTRSTVVMLTPAASAICMRVVFLAMRPD
jgi:hypothetical protein